MQHSEFRPWRCGDSWKFPVPNPKPNKHWEECHDLVQKYDEDTFKAWKGEVDNLLIFAGLFSATVTSFTIESYRWLVEEPDDQAIQILAHMSMQLKDLQNNSTTPPYIVDEFSVSASEVRINVLWFLSLTLSMATVLIGILCMQWLREFGRDAARSHKDAIAIRQMRYEGLHIWKVPLILSLLPLLLQLALVLFFAGMLELLWAHNHTVAIWISVVVFLVLLLLVLTTVLPALQSHFTKDPFLKVGQCPYKSPQAWAFYRLTIHLARAHKLMLEWSARFALCMRKQVLSDIEDDAGFDVTADTASASGLSHFNRLVRADLDKNWCDYDVRWRLMRDATYLDPETGEPSGYQDGDDIVRGLMWIDQTFSEDIDTVYYIYHCLYDLNSTQAAQLVGALDPEVAYLPQLLLPTDEPALYANSPIEDLQVEEHIYMVFLWLHRHIHPSLHNSYLECMIRLMNSNSRCVPRLALRQCDEDLDELSDETVYQFLHSFKLVVQNDAITKEQGSDIWAFLRDVYARHPGIHSPLMHLTFDIFAQFHAWLRPYAGPLALNDVDYRHRVETCAVGLTRVVALLDAQAIEMLRDEIGERFESLEELVKEIDAAMRRVIGQSAILHGLNKRRWPEVIGKVLGPAGATNSTGTGTGSQEKEGQAAPTSVSISVSVSHALPVAVQDNPPVMYPDVDKVSLPVQIVHTDTVVPGYSAQEVVSNGEPIADNHRHHLQ
ncbi:hypothetical protein JR316_0001718 [Psilocybe cubensis]|uniref:Uncharacterized protein n=2 Tax=Psilocybe cubensis TaxID=181762 RepID=A0ACB8HAC2_PSICU|nr:hypothetical protein JR316_0001718 [Psilocybe cubensis]KAH9484816.1 hypothetical protein JR316_0001718 [Psilocybe cubensis]